MVPPSPTSSSILLQRFCDVGLSACSLTTLGFARSFSSLRPGAALDGCMLLPPGELDTCLGVASSSSFSLCVGWSRWSVVGVFVLSVGVVSLCFRDDVGGRRLVGCFPIPSTPSASRPASSLASIFAVLSVFALLSRGNVAGVYSPFPRISCRKRRVFAVRAFGGRMPGSCLSVLIFLTSDRPSASGSPSRSSSASGRPSGLSSVSSVLSRLRLSRSAARLFRVVSF